MPPTSSHTIDDAVRVLPGGTYYTAGWHSPPVPEFILSHGAGAYVYTQEGRRLLDVNLGHGSLLLGHCPAAVVDAVKVQLERGTIFAHISGPAIELAHMLVQVIPCAQKVRLVNSGSEGMLLALRLVRAFTGKEKFLKFEGAYHGFTDPFMFNTNYGHPTAWADPPQPVADTLGIPACERDLVLVARYNDLDHTRQIIRDHHQELAGIFVEPVMRGLASRPGFLEGVRELASQYHIPLVFDEVITGFRLALGGAQAYYQVTPDLAVFGKGFGAGYPIGAVAGSEELMSLLDPASDDDHRIYALGSFHANPLSATAALTNLRELAKPGVYQRLNAYGDQLSAGLVELFARYGLTVQMTGAGSIVEFFFTPEPITDYRSTLRSNLDLKRLLGQTMPQQGVFGGGGRYNASTCHGAAELDLMLAAVEAGLQQIRQTGQPPQG